MALRKNIKDCFDKGRDPGDEIMEQLYFLDPKTRDLVEKMTVHYDRVVTPDDFKAIAKLMSEHLSIQVPILKDFTKFFGRLAEDYLKTTKPSKADFDWKSIIKANILGNAKKGYILPDRVSEILGIKRGEAVSDKFLRRFSWYKPDSTLAEIINGVASPKARAMGAKYGKIELEMPLGAKIGIFKGIEIFKANKLPKSWTNVPWVNFDGKVIEQNFTQSFEERLSYKDAQGNWVTNFVQVAQKSEMNVWDQVVNEKGKFDDIADAGQARTAFAVNGNHSNDATLVKNFHLWGRDNNIATSTIHDAFFANAADMLPGRAALRNIYARTVERESIRATLDEMHARGLPDELYNQYLNEAIDKGLIPVAGRSVVGGRVLTQGDILTTEDVLQQIPEGFSQDYGFYGVG
jgi:hypothetical protein